MSLEAIYGAHEAMFQYFAVIFEHNLTICLVDKSWLQLEKLLERQMLAPLLLFLKSEIQTLGAESGISNLAWKLILLLPN